MHPRQLSRAPHQRLSPADISRLVRGPLPDPAIAAPVPCAFHAPRDGSGWAIQVARDFTVTFVVSGLTLSFARGTGIVLHYVENWTGKDRMVIAIDKVWGTPDHRLVALREADLDDNLRAFTLGGFDLDPTGAVLAGSFWDANLDDVPVENAQSDGAAQAQAANPVARQIADIFVDRARDGYADTTGLDLVREGISERDAMQHYEAGAALAAAELRDTDLSADRVAYDRQGRVMVGANAVAGLLLQDTATVHTACRLAGLSTAEVGNLFDDIVGEAMRLVREARAILVAH